MAKSSSLPKQKPKAEKTEGKSLDFLQVNTRFISLVTYAEIPDLESVLRDHENAVEGCTYIFHDRDNKEPHKHIALVLKRARRIADVIGWFKSCVDLNGKAVNTQGEKIKSLKALKLYFLHKDEKSISLGKFQYAETDLIVLTPFKDAFSFETADDKTGGMDNEERKEEENRQFLADIENGTPLREMACKYGRDWMKNYKYYRHYVTDMLLEEGSITLDVALARGDTILEEKTNIELQQRFKKGFEQGVVLTYHEIIEKLQERIKAGDTYLNSTLDQIQTMLKEFF